MSSANMSTKKVRKGVMMEQIPEADSQDADSMMQSSVKKKKESLYQSERITTAKKF